MINGGIFHSGVGKSLRIFFTVNSILGKGYKTRARTPHPPFSAPSEGLMDKGGTARTEKLRMVLRGRDFSLCRDMVWNSLFYHKSLGEGRRGWTIRAGTVSSGSPTGPTNVPPVIVVKQSKAAPFWNMVGYLHELMDGTLILFKLSLSPALVICSALRRHTHLADLPLSFLLTP